MTINKMLCPSGLGSNPNRPLKSIDYITIHNTGNYNASATAENHASLQYRGNNGVQASWHYTVDKAGVWQSYEDCQECWHAGDGSNGPGNYTSIAVEICVNDKEGFSEACDNTARLTAELLARYGLGIDRVVQHNKWSGKNCPTELRSCAWGVTWQDFINMTEKYLREEFGGSKTACGPDGGENQSTLTQPGFGTPILGPPKVTVMQMVRWARKKNAPDFFVDLVSLFYDFGIAAGVNPLVAYCQSAKETGFGRFGGVLDESFHNPCGMKKTDGGADGDPCAHKRFETWAEGITAQIDHLALYAGAAGYPKKNSPDPRHFPYLMGVAKTVEELGGKWAPAPAYGKDIAAMIRELENSEITAEDKISLVIGGDILAVPAENIEGFWCVTLPNPAETGMPQQIGVKIRIRDILSAFGYADLSWDQASRTITAIMGK